MLTRKNELAILDMLFFGNEEKEEKGCKEVSVKKKTDARELVIGARFDDLEFYVRNIDDYTETEQKDLWRFLFEHFDGEYFNEQINNLVATYFEGKKNGL